VQGRQGIEGTGTARII